MKQALQISATNAQALSPLQKQLKKLQEQNHKAREAVQAWDRELPLYAEAFAQTVQPQRLRCEQLLRDFASQLALWLQTAKWGRVQREELREIVSTMAQDVLDEHQLDEADFMHWKAVHDAHADLDYDDQRDDELNFLKSLVAEQVGLNLDDLQLADEADLMEQLRAKLQEAQAAQAQQAPNPAAKRSTAAQRRKQAEQEAAAQAAKQSLREVYRKLASQLHPDRASDSFDAAQRTAQMAHVNAAYEQQDLLALLNLQLELEQIDPDHLLRASEAQLRHMTGVLKEQQVELRLEIEQRERAFVEGFGAPVGARLDPTRLGPLLHSALSHWQAQAHQAEMQLRVVESPDSTRQWLKALREEAKLQRRWGW